ncbi:MAG: amidohydrolase family protein, partial [Actinomycetia bacterium]|nr:amidohydrolase family protein [Actinomycetes bacterium]
GGAAAIGLANQIGTIEVGKRADVVAHRLDQPAMAPFTDPVEVWTCSGPDQVHSVWVDGRRVVEDGRLTLADEGQIAVQAQRARADLVAR